jgi:hypothetical protein
VSIEAVCVAAARDKNDVASIFHARAQEQRRIAFTEQR